MFIAAVTSHTPKPQRGDMCIVTSISGECGKAAYRLTSNLGYINGTVSVQSLGGASARLFYQETAF